MTERRLYRNFAKAENLSSFQVTVKETDVFVQAKSKLNNITKKLIIKYRTHIENYIKKNPEFLTTLEPWQINEKCPKIIKKMINASHKAGVGPMAAVAGAIAEAVGKDLLKYSDEVIVENGGDIFIKLNKDINIGIFAGKSPLSMRVGIHIDSINKPISICTSSGTIGHSLSFGKADAVCVVSNSCTLSDAAATSIANLVKNSSDITDAVAFGKKIKGVKGVVIIMNDLISIGGEIEIVPLKLIRNEEWGISN